MALSLEARGNDMGSMGRAEVFINETTFKSHVMGSNPMANEYIYININHLSKRKLQIEYLELASHKFLDNCQFEIFL